MLKILFLTTTLLLASVPSWAQTPAVQGTVISVGDGDTLRANINGKPTTIRLACIDAPESSQAPYGPAARQRLQQLAPVGSKIWVDVKTTDRYGRTIALVATDKQSINLAMVQEGYAPVYRQYLNACPNLKTQLLNAELQAKEQRWQFWAQPNPVMPWDYRKQHSKQETIPSQSAGAISSECPKEGCSCKTFKTWQDAQTLYESLLPLDPYNLDGDKDGIACEGLKR